MAREVKVVIRLVDDMKERFQSHAEELGMSMSALGAYIIGQYMKNQDRIVNPINEAVLEAVKSAVKDGTEEAMWDEEGLKMMIEQMSSALMNRKARRRQ